MHRVILLQLILLNTFSVFAQENVYEDNITLKIENIESAEGNILVMIYTNDESFAEEDYIKKFTFTKSNFDEGKITVTLGLVPGKYGLSVIDDKNKNGQHDRSFIGYPREGFGFSNFYLNGLRRPNFEEFSFDVKSEEVVVSCKLRYM
jgi:uncharacterized protein (DUF2141 family)